MSLTPTGGAAMLPASRFDASLERLHKLYPKLIDLKLERLVRLLGALGNPQQKLPPVIHVAGTNGKGSVCAFTRAIAEAAGLRVHVYTSPHLVRFNERIRLAGELVEDEALAAALDEIETVNEGNQITVFEAITAAALLLFSRVPADLCVVEVGLGGRFDATNVVTPVSCAITAISMDHQDFLGDTLGVIAAEKAGIIKPGIPVITGTQEAAALAAITQEAETVGAPLLRRDRDWRVEVRSGRYPLRRAGPAAPGAARRASGGKCRNRHGRLARGGLRHPHHSFCRRIAKRDLARPAATPYRRAAATTPAGL